MSSRLSSSVRPLSLVIVIVTVIVAVVGGGLGGFIRRNAGATTALSLGLVGAAIFGLFLPAGFSQYLPAAATQVAVTVHRTAGRLRPGTALAVLAVCAVIAFPLASIRVAHRDARRNPSKSIERGPVDTRRVRDGLRWASAPLATAPGKRARSRRADATDPPGIESARERPGGHLKVMSGHPHDG